MQLLQVYLKCMSSLSDTRWRSGPKIIFSSLLLIAQFVVYLHQMFLTREYTFSRLITLQKRCHVHRHLCTKIEKTHQTGTKNRTKKMIAFSWFCFYKMFCTIDNYYPKSKVICKKSTLVLLCSEKFFKERKFFFRTRGAAVGRANFQCKIRAKQPISRFL